MKFKAVTAKDGPMLFLTRTVPMAAIGEAMSEAFQKLGIFLGRNAVAPAGPPIAIYRNHRQGEVTVDVGFPVPHAELAKVSGEIRVGVTPAGDAFKAVHRGSYARLRDSYGEVEVELGKAGHQMPAFSWEVYLNGPDRTPPEDLVTEIYLPVKASVAQGTGPTIPGVGKP